MISKAAPLILAALFLLGILLPLEQLRATSSQPKKGKLNVGDEKKANNAFAQKLINLLKDPSMAVGQINQGTSQVDANSLTPFSSNTTYHSYVWSYCLNWVTPTTCEKWLDPYVSLHGMGGNVDQSPLEGAIASLWNRYKEDSVDPNQGGGQKKYGIWNIQARNGQPILKVDDIAKRNALDPTALSRWELLPEVQKRAEEIGKDTADRAIASALEKNEDGGRGVLLNSEKARIKAATWTRALRNRLLSNLGEARAAAPGIEFELGEDIADCEAYLQQIDDKESMSQEPGTLPFPLRDIETRVNQDPQTRYELCIKAREMSIGTINPTVSGGTIAAGDPDRERYDAAVNRINLALIDYAGTNPNDYARPTGVSFTVDEYATKLSDYEVGGLEYAEKKKTNARVLNSYNKALKKAASSMKAVAARSGGWIEDNSQRIEGFQIQVGSKNLMQINGLTDEMKYNLGDTELKEQPVYQLSGVFTTHPDDESIEKKPSELTVTKK